MSAVEIAPYLSLALAIVFWILTTIQAFNAKRTLNDIKNNIITWQGRLNDASINLISSRPEIIAKETLLEEAKSLVEYSSQLNEQIKKLSSTKTSTDEEADFQLKILDRLLHHQNKLILGRQQIMSQAVAAQKAKGH